MARRPSPFPYDPVIEEYKKHVDRLTLDLLGEITGGGGYHDLLLHTIVLRFSRP